MRILLHPTSPPVTDDPARFRYAPSKTVWHSHERRDRLMAKNIPNKCSTKKSKSDMPRHTLIGCRGASCCLRYSRGLASFPAWVSALPSFWLNSSSLQCCPLSGEFNISCKTTFLFDRKRLRDKEEKPVFFISSIMARGENVRGSVFVFIACAWLHATDNSRFFDAVRHVVPPILSTHAMINRLRSTSLRSWATPCVLYWAIYVYFYLVIFIWYIFVILNKWKVYITLSL